MGRYGAQVFDQGAQRLFFDPQGAASKLVTGAAILAIGGLGNSEEDHSRQRLRQRRMLVEATNGVPIYGQGRRRDRHCLRIIGDNWELQVALDLGVDAGYLPRSLFLFYYGQVTNL